MDVYVGEEVSFLRLTWFRSRWWQDYNAYIVVRGRRTSTPRSLLTLSRHHITHDGTEASIRVTGHIFPNAASPIKTEYKDYPTFLYL